MWRKRNWSSPGVDDMKRIFILVVFILGLSSISIGAMSAESSSIVVSLRSVDEGSDGGSKYGRVNVRIENRSDGDVRLLRHSIPFGGAGDMFVVIEKITGERIPYEGRLVNWLPPTKDDFLVVPAGGYVEATVDLLEFYDISRSGVYEIDFLSMVQVLTADGAEFLELVSDDSLTFRNDVEIRVDRPLPRSGYVSLSSHGLRTFGCNEAQQAVLANAHALAEQWSFNARNSLQSQIVGARYRTWFGRVATHVPVVKAHFENIYFETRARITDYWCDCTQSGAYAYVVKGIQRVHFCPAYWSASAAQQAHAIVHEMSHLSRGVGFGSNGTEDHVYGQAQSEQLAYANPAYAADNADNYGFYAQNPYNQSN